METISIVKPSVVILNVLFGLIVESCQCTNQNLDEFEGEHYDRHEEDKTVIYKGEHEKVKNDYNEKESNLNTNLEKVYPVGLPQIVNDTAFQILRRKNYVVSYNQGLKIPNWVAWHLTAEHADGDIKRFASYLEDEEVPEPRATNEDYKGSAWSHGHMCPAGDNKWNAEAMKESNLLTNMCPQDRNLNSGLWNRIEMDCRKWAKQYGSVYIVCGPLLYNKEHETIGANKVVVPEAFFKVVLCLEGKPKAIGFVVKNNAGTKKKDQYVNTVDEVERLTGIDFFPALPDSIENVVEAYANLEDWR